jgi:hypothetical protein
MTALAEGGEATLLTAARALDPEILVLWLKDRIEVWLRPNEPEWEPPEGAQTLEGQFYFRARKEGDDLADLRALLDALFRDDYWTYFRMLQGATWELESETEEWALRWRTGRLLDLGFPSWEEAMAIYGVLPAASLAELPEAAPVLEEASWRLPIWMPRLPVSAASAQALYRALAGLGDEERQPHLLAFLALANRVAVADRLPLGDAESIPIAVEKAAEFVSRGLEHVAAERGLAEPEVLRRTTLERLFRVGFSLSRARRE